MFASPRTPGRSRRSTFLNSSVANTSINTPTRGGANTSLLQSSCIQETASHVIESFGATLPVHIVESILYLERQSNVSLVISESSWIWLIIRNKLLIWQYCSSRSSSKNCVSLELANSILMHHAGLCNVSAWDSTTPSCIVVSPMGVIRFWPNISHEGVFTETVIDICGEECFSLIPISKKVYMLGTTSGSLIKVIIHDLNGSSSIETRKIKVQQGVLKEIGKRVSSFIFGAMPIAGETRVARKLLAGTSGDSVYILFENALQNWEGLSDDTEVCKYDVDIECLIKDAFRTNLWNTEAMDDEDISCWCIDSQVCQEGLLILTAAVNQRLPPSLTYALGILDARNPTEMRHFTALNESWAYADYNSEHLLSARCILPHGQEVFVYTKNKISAVNIVTKEQDVINLSDVILGCGSYNGLPLFLTQYNHLVSVRSTGRQARQPMIAEESIRISESFVDDLDDSSEGRVKKALVHFCRGEMIQCGQALDNVFPTLQENEDIEGLDETIVNVSRVLLDETPAGDPRWGKSKTTSNLSTGSVLIENNISDKLKVYNFFLQFLKVNGIWQKFKTVSIDGMKIQTRFALREHLEWLSIAQGLYHGYESIKQIQPLMDNAIQRVISSRKEKSLKGLTSKDMFYVKITRVFEIFEALQSYLMELVQQEDPDLLTIIYQANLVFVNGLAKLKSTRKEFAAEDSDLHKEYLPWSARLLRAILIKQHELCDEHAISHTYIDKEKRSAIIEQMSSMCWVVLEDYQIHINSLAVCAPKRVTEKVKQQMSTDRQKLIGSFIRHKFFDIAVVLAEEFYDFAYLVKICEDTHNQDKLFEYMETFKRQNFSEFVFQYYLDSGNRSKLLQQPAAYNQQLSKFLQSHQNLNWLHCIRTDDFMKAAQSLQQLAGREERLLGRKKLEVSLAKLCALASGEKDLRKQAPHSDLVESFLQDTQHMEDIITIQENLSKDILIRNGISSEDAPVLAPLEMINMVMTSNSRREADFKTALDLLEYSDLSSKDSKDMRLKIWSKAALADEWEYKEGSKIGEIMRDLLFFQIVDLAYLQNLDLKEFLPDLDTLINCDHLLEMRGNTCFEYVIRAGYEHVYKHCAV